MEKRIKLSSSSKSTAESVKKQELGINLSSSTNSSSKEKSAKKGQKDINEINGKRIFSSIEIQDKPLKKFKSKDLARRSRIRMKKKDVEGNSSSESGDDDQTLDDSLLINDIKTKKRKNNKSEEKTANFQSEAEAHLELTDEETQTSKAEENSNNSNRTSGTRAIPNVMDQFGLGQSFSEQLFQQQLKSNLCEDQSNKKTRNELVSNLETMNDETKESARQGHYSFGDKPLRIVKTEYNENANDVVFTMDWKKSDIHPAPSQITREELLKYDPLLLVYYYEKHLEFTQYPNQIDFDLEKIPH